MPTDKTEIIEAIFRQRWSAKGRKLSEPIVTLTDVSEAIADYNRKHRERQMSTRNPANFFKDFIRNRESANRNWPPFVFESGYAARQVTGKGLCFEFVALAEGQHEPFPAGDFAAPTNKTPLHRIESVSMPLASRKLGRNDEPWLIQVITRLRIIETHFSLYSKRKVKQVDLLQMSVKLMGTEIDSLFLLQEEGEQGELREVIVTAEAKRGRDDILEDQILRQAKAPFRMPQVTQDVVVPVAVKCIGPSKIYVVEFSELDRGAFEGVDSLTIASDSLFEIVPPVPGICD